MQILRGSGPLETSLYLKKMNKIKFGKNFLVIFSKIIIKQYL